MRKIYVLFLMGLMSLSLWASSNFCFYDWYEEYSLTDAAANGMAGTSVAWRKHNYALTNPAHIGKMQNVMFSISFSAMKLYSKTDIYDFEDEYGYFPNMQLGFRFLGKVPLMMGYVQHYNVGMESEYEDPDTDEYTETVTLKGGLNSVFLGAGYELGSFSFGAINHWYFGRKAKENERDYVDSQVHDSQTENTYKFWGIGFDLGANYRWKNLNFGVAASLPFEMDGKHKRKNLGETVFSEDIKAEFPQQYRIGASYVMGDNVLASDFTYSLWENYRLADFENTFQNTYRLSAGWEKMMKVKELRFLSRAAFRLGGYYQTLSLEDENGDQLTEYGVSAGISVPFVKKIANLMNFSVTYGARSPYGNVNLEESFVRFSVNVNFFDSWEKAKNPEEDIQIPVADPRYLKEDF